MKYLAEKYYHFLILIIIYLVFNVTVRGKIINWVVNPSPNDPITMNADAFSEETSIRNLFIYSLLTSLAFLAILSLALLFSKKGKPLSKVILISVPTLICLLFFLVYLMGGFS